MSTITKEQVAQSFVDERLPKRSIVGYGFGDFANNLAFTLSTSFLLYYYTDVAGLSAAAVATMFFVVRLWDAFADMFAGRLVDRTMTRMGKFRPFILFGAVPLLFLSYLTFHVPSSLDDGAKLLYAYVTYAVLGLVYSLVNIPYGSLASAMTQSVKERAKLVSSRFFGGAVGGIVLTYIIAPKISSLKGEKKSISAAEYQEKVQAIFTQTTLLFIVIGSLAYLITWYFCREKVVRTAPRVSLRETWDTLRGNKPLGYLCAASFFYSSVSSPWAAPRPTTPSTSWVTSSGSGLSPWSTAASPSSPRPSSPSLSTASARRRSSSGVASSPWSVASRCSSRRPVLLLPH